MVAPTALNKDLLLRVARMHVFTAPEGTPAPDWESFDPKAPIAPWAPLAHTVKEEVFKLSKSGGEVTLIDTAQEDGVDQSTAAVARAIDVTAVSLGADQLDYAYNGEYNEATKEYDVPSTSAPLVKDIYFFMKTVTDKTVTLRTHGAISAGDEPSLSFSELAKVPLHVDIRPDANGKTLHWGGHAITATASVTV